MTPIHRFTDVELLAALDRIEERYPPAVCALAEMLCAAERSVDFNSFQSPAEDAWAEMVAGYKTRHAIDDDELLAAKFDFMACTLPFSEGRYIETDHPAVA